MLLLWTNIICLKELKRDNEYLIAKELLSEGWNSFCLHIHNINFSSCCHFLHISQQSIIPFYFERCYATCQQSRWWQTNSRIKKLVLDLLVLFYFLQTSRVWPECHASLSPSRSNMPNIFGSIEITKDGKCKIYVCCRVSSDGWWCWPFPSLTVYTPNQNTSSNILLDYEMGCDAMVVSIVIF